jgi:hypothetical protein
MSDQEIQMNLFGDEPDLINVEKDPEKSGLEEMEDRAFERYCERHTALIAKLAELGLPAPGQQFRLVTRRTFNAIEFLEYIVEQETILDLKMAIYSINFYAAKILLNLVNEGKIQAVEILMSNLRNKAHREKEEIVKKMFLDHPKISLFFASSHAKMFSCRTSKGNFYTLEGSGNLAFNSRVEQYVIDNDRTLYEFSCSWMRDIKIFLEGKKELEFS